LKEKDIREYAIIILKENKFGIINGEYKGARSDLIARKNNRNHFFEIKASLLRIGRQVNVSTRYEAIGQCLFYYYRLKDEATEIILLLGNSEGVEEVQNVIDMFGLPIRSIELKHLEEWAKTTT
jgi:hypothetical protein